MKSTAAQFANMKVDSDQPSFRVDSCVDSCVVLTGEHTDCDSLSSEELESILKHIPPSSKVHLVVVRKLQDEYFRDEKPLVAPFLAQAELQYATFYRISQVVEEMAEATEETSTKAKMEEFSELMEARGALTG